MLYSNYYALTTKKEIISSRLKNKELEERNTNLIEITDNVRCFKHDFNNIIQAIGGFISVKDINSLEKYLEPLFDECQRINAIDVLNERMIENPAICGILISKLKMAEKTNVKMNVEILTNLSNLREKSYLISRMLGIMIDNAIEASSCCKDNREIDIQILSKKDQMKNIITIENTYDEKDIDIEKIFEKNFSTKEGNTGLGLWKIKDILKKDTSFGLITSKDEKIFRQELEIYC